MPGFWSFAPVTMVSIIRCAISFISARDDSDRLPTLLPATNSIVELLFSRGALLFPFSSSSYGTSGGVGAICTLILLFYFRGLERRWGSPRTLLFGLTSTAIGFLASLLLVPHEGTRLLFAPSALVTLMAFATRYFMEIPSKITERGEKEKVNYSFLFLGASVAGLLVANDALASSTAVLRPFRSSIPGVPIFAHVGLAVIGVVVGFVLRYPAVDRVMLPLSTFLFSKFFRLLTRTTGHLVVGQHTPLPPLGPDGTPLEWDSPGVASRQQQQQFRPSAQQRQASSVPQQQQAASPAPAGVVIDQQKIDSIVEIGFPVEEARHALEACGGNVDAAVSLLLGVDHH